MAEPTVYTRRISFNERLYIAAEELKPGFCIQMVAEGDGEISEDALRAAVNRAAECNPGSRLVQRGVLGWARWVACGPVPPVRVVTGWNEADRAPPELERPLSPRVGPTCEVVLAPLPRPRIVFRCFHGVMDASGLLLFAEDVFRALRGEPLLGTDCALSDTEIVESLVGNRKRAPIKSDRRTVTAGHSHVPSAVHWRRLRIEKPGPALVARIATSLARHAAQFHATPTRVMIPVDLRNYKRNVRATGNMTYPLLIDVPAERTWRDLQKEILKRLAAKEPLQLDPGEKIVPWLPAALLRLVYRLWIRSHRRSGWFPFSALVTHLALPAEAALDGAGFRLRGLYFLPPQTDFIPLAVSIVSANGAAELVVSAPRGYVDDAQLQCVCDALRASLVEP